MSNFIGHTNCPDCESSDALAVYYNEEEDSFTGCCWSFCKGRADNGFKNHNKIVETDFGIKNGLKPISRGKKVSKEESPKKKLTAKKKSLSPISKEKLTQLQENTSTKTGGKFRGIPEKWYEFFKCRFGYDEETGDISEVYYPVTMGTLSNGNPKLMGFHKRIVIPEKRFIAYPAGSIGKECDLFGSFRWKGCSRLVICGGENDVIAAKYMHEEYRQRQARKGSNIAEVDFGCSVTGEGVAAEQIRLNYEKIDQYDEIILDLDSDEAGQKAEEALLDVLPLHKTKIMRYSSKDANEALEQGQADDYIRAIYNARRPSISGIVSSLDLHEKVLQGCDVDMIPLPPILHKANSMLGGGLPLGEIVNILAASGIGKTTIIGEFTYHWIFNSPHKVGVLSYEANSSQYGLKLLSRHLGVNLLKIVDKDEEGSILPTKRNRRDFLLREDILEQSRTLYVDEKGDERFALIDDRDEMTDLETIKKKILQLIKAHQVKVILIDPASDLLGLLDLKEQEGFLSWLKKMKSRGITFVLVNHSRKGAGGKVSGARGGELDEQDMMGSGSIYRSGAVNIILERDKEAEDENERNTTKVRITKNRDGGVTGKADELYYDIETHSLHNKREYLNQSFS